MIRRLVPLALLAGVVACGGEGSAPELSEITLSRSSLTRGQQFFAMAKVRDVDGDLDRGTVHIEFRNLGDHQVVVFGEELQIFDVEPGDGEVELILGLRILGEMEPDAFELVLAVTDNAGQRSAPISIGLEITQ